MPDEVPFNPLVILDAHGQPLRRPTDATCPKCAAGPDRRVVHHPFGQEPVAVCGTCGHEFEGGV